MLKCLRPAVIFKKKERFSLQKYRSPAAPAPQKKAFPYRLAVICIVSLIVAGYSLSLKADFHNDEYTSFTIANNAGPGGMMFSPVDHVRYEDPAQPYLEAMTVSAGGGFQYGQVWKNDAMDTLPPLYYALLHTVSSFFPGRLSLWFGGGINLVFLLLSILFLYKLLSRLDVSEGGKLLTCLLFGVLPGIMEMVQFLRMYTMTMFWVILLSYAAVGVLQRPAYSFRQAVCLAIPTICGVLSHYYFLLFAVFQCLVIGCWFLLHRRWRDTGFFVLTFVVAAGLTIAIYPGILQQLFTNWLMPTTLSNLATAGDFFTRLKGFFFVMNTRLFGGFLPEFGLACLIVLLLAPRPAMQPSFWAAIRLAIQKNIAWVGLLLPTALYFLLMTKIAFFTNTRYMCLIYPLLLCVAVEVGMRLLLACRPGEALSRGIAALLCAVIILSAYQIYPPKSREYAGYGEGRAIRAMAEHAALDAVCVYTTPWSAQNTYRLNESLGGLVFTRPDTLGELPKAIAPSTASFLLEIEKTQDDEEILQSVMALYPHMGTPVQVAENLWYTVYLLAE